MKTGTKSPHEGYFLPPKNIILTTIFSTIIGILIYSIFYDSFIYEAKIKLTKDLLPILFETYPQDQNFKSIIINIDDDDLNLRNMRWPAPMHLYTSAIKAAVKRDAKAIYLDVIFSEPKQESELNDFLNTVCLAKKNNIAIFLPEMISPQTGQQPDTLAKLRARRVDDKPDSPTCLNLVSSEIPVEKADRAVWTYRLNSAETKDHPTVINSPALSIAQHFNPNLVITKPQNMALSWPTHGNEENLAYITSDKADIKGAALKSPNCILEINTLKKISGSKLIKGMGDLANGNLPLCAFHRELSLAAFMNTPAPQKSAKSPKLIYLIGTSFFGGGKPVATPLEQLLPATHVHAVALDNLLKLGNHYPKSENVLAFDSAFPKYCFAICVLLLICIFNTVWQMTNLPNTLKTLRKIRFLRMFPWFIQAGKTVRGQPRWIKRIWRIGLSMVWIIIGSWLVLRIGRGSFHIAIVELTPFIALPLLSIFLNSGKAMTKYLSIFLVSIKNPNRWHTLTECLNHEAKMQHR